MSFDRRDFLRLAGLSVLGFAARSAFEPVPAGEIAQEHPLTARRWAMVVDLRKCLAAGDCRKCIDACHRVHNVPDFGNPKDEIKWIWREHFPNAFSELETEIAPEALLKSTVPVLCNHCDNPPCVRVCPTRATWKREEDGVVMMDWHRCIGCRYCIVACPYGSRSFNWRDPRPFLREISPEFPTRMRGVVEKCNFCEERLAQGLRPACVEACADGALMFGDLEDPQSEVRRVLQENLALRRKAALGTKPQVYYLV